MRKPAVLLVAAVLAGMPRAPAMAADAGAIETDLAITMHGGVKKFGLDEALTLLNIPSVSIALIDRGQIALPAPMARTRPRTRSIRRHRCRNSWLRSAPCASSSRASSRSIPT